jgi:hypothetical protein
LVIQYSLKTERDNVKVDVWFRTPTTRNLDLALTVKIAENGDTTWRTRVMKPNEYLALAKDCERLARLLPAHASTLHKIAEAWRDLARNEEKKEKSAGDGKSADTHD